MAQVIIEVDGPSHFSVNSRRPLGRTVARKLMIEGRGYIVRSIPYYEWCSLDSVEVRQTYLWRLLASAVALSPESAQLPSLDAANLDAGQLNLPLHSPPAAQLPLPPMTADSPIAQQQQQPIA
jgi:hypothetical protein